MSKQTIDSIRKQAEDITPYQVHLVINETLQGLGEDRRIVPQMMYNYDRNGLIVKGQKNQKRYTWAEVEAFAIRWFKKNYDVDLDATVTPEVEEESTEVEGQLELIEV